MINLQQGNFTSDGFAKYLAIRSDVDWIKVINYTNMAATPASDVVSEFYWQRGMPQGGGMLYTRATTTAILSSDLVATGGGFYLIDSYNSNPSVPYALTDISTATPPVVTSAAGAQFVSTGDIVRLYNVTGATQFSGIDFSATAINSTTFSLPYAPTIGAAATAGTFRIINDLAFYPRVRTISSISQAAQAVVKTTVNHGFTPGQRVRFKVPSVFGMTQIDDVYGNVVSVYNGASAGLLNTFTVDIDTSSFTAFAWPATGGPRFTPAQVIPVGENTPTAINPVTPQASYILPPSNQFLDATRNTAFLGIKLVAGASSPAGIAGDQIYWIAGKSFNVNNEI